MPVFTPPTSSVVIPDEEASFDLFDFPLSDAGFDIMEEEDIRYLWNTYPSGMGDQGADGGFSAGLWSSAQHAS
jgi:hypothetical protein